MRKTVCDDRTKKGLELRAVVVKTIQELMQHDDKIIALEADLGGASKFTEIKKTNPDRFIQCGIAEANMIGVAAGLSLVGFKPFIHTFGPFATRRVFDQLFLSGAYAGNTLNIYGSDPGFCAGANGGTHTTFEDVALVTAIPHTIVCDAADACELAWIIKEFSRLSGIHYVRANRKSVRNVYREGTEFTLGKGNILKDGQDVLIVAAGQLVSDALDCAEKLESEGISCEVIDMFCIKPLDKELLLKEVQGKKALVTFENHNIHGGLGSMVAETIAEANVNVKFKRHGIDERFGQVGTQEFLQAEFHLEADDLAKTIKTLLAQ